MLRLAAPGATLLLNAPFGPDEVWDHLPRAMQQRIIDLKLQLFVIDASGVAAECRTARPHPTPCCRPASSHLSGVLPRDAAIAQIKQSIRKTYEHARRGRGAAQFRTRSMRRSATCSRCGAGGADQQLGTPADGARQRARLRARGHRADAGRPRRRNPGQHDAGRRHLAVRHRRLGEAQRRRNRADLEPGPVHPVRPVQLRLPARRDPGPLFRRRHGWTARRTASNPHRSTCAASRMCASRLQFSVEDCTGCGAVLRSLPGSQPDEPADKAIVMRDKLPLIEPERDNARFFADLPVNDRARVDFANVRGVQFLEPLFAFSGACAGCGETPYLKLLSQLFGDRAADRQRHRLLVDLWRQPAGHAVGRQSRRPRPRLVQLPVRGQRRVRPGLPPGRRPARRTGAQPG